MHLLFVCHATTGANPAATAAVALANGMAARKHSVTLYCQCPVHRFLYPLYQLGCFFYRMSLPDGQQPLPSRGLMSINALYHVHHNVSIVPYSFTYRNINVQRLRRALQNLDIDACVCQFAGREQLTWAVTLLGSGIPFVYSELQSPDAIEAIWNRKERLVAMSGADRIHMLSSGYVDSVPVWLRDKICVISAPSTVNTDLSSRCEVTLNDETMDAWEELLNEASAHKGVTTMDSFAEEPFASQARMYSVARREWLWRDFGKPIPGTIEAWSAEFWDNAKNWLKSIFALKR